MIGEAEGEGFKMERLELGGGGHGVIQLSSGWGGGGSEGRRKSLRISVLRRLVGDHGSKPESFKIPSTSVRIADDPGRWTFLRPFRTMNTSLAAPRSARVI
jgi:hypothetical protein